jgi:hypothetical protein
VLATGYNIATFVEDNSAGTNRNVITFALQYRF